MPLASGKLMLIDGNSLVNRAFYALPPLATSDGTMTNAVFGFLTMLFRLMEEERPDALGVTFDKSTPTFRHQAFAAYKAQRTGTPAELRAQIPLLKEVLRALNIQVLELEGYEADDLLGTLVARAEERGYHTVIVTGDRDALQLVSDHTTALITRKGISELRRYDGEAVQQEYGLRPHQLVDLKGLMGDPSDNIPGVPGVGEKTALRLIQEFGNLENLLGHLEGVSGEKLRRALAENAEQAVLSKELATIRINAPLEIDLEDLRLREPDRDRARELFRRLEFKTLLRKLEGEGTPQVVEAPGIRLEGRSYRVVDSPSVLRELMSNAGRGKKLSVAAEIDRPGGFIYLALAVAPGLAYYLTRAPEALTGEIGDLFRHGTIEKLGHDIKPLVVFLLRQGVEVRGVTFDSTVAAYLLNPTRLNYRLSDLAREYLRESLPSREDLLGKGRGAIPFSALEPQLARDYLCSRADATLRLQDLMLEEIRQAQLEFLFTRVEMPLVEILADMEYEGIGVDLAQLKEMSAELGRRLEDLTREIWELAGGEFNINSTRQLGQVLYEKLGLPVTKKTKTGYSTDADVLEGMAGLHPIINRLLDYRQLMKLKSTYADGLSALVNPATGRVHTTFNQTITATGRLSSTEPNLQNIPIRMELGRRIRRVFVPSSPEHTLVVADYSQMELRILAHIAGDEKMMESFLRGEDIHARTASEVFGVPLEEVTPEMRGRAKAVNFGIVYGMSDYGLARELNIGRKEAGEYIRSYFQRYPGVKGYMDRVITEAREKGYVTTILHRRRYLPELYSRNPSLRAFAERTAINTPIQGSAADIIKKAMVEVYHALRSRGLKSRMILQVHDELVFDGPREELPELKELVVDRMENAVPLRLPLKVELKAGPNWYEMKRVGDSNAGAS